MQQQFPALALAVIDTRPHRHEERERTGAAAGPGWFDSSWDLHRGLEVRESWSDDERVHSWIEDFLRNQRRIDRAVPARAGDSPVIGRCALTAEVNAQR